MLTQGTFIADRYEVIEMVGSGGMSEVYRAKDHILGREVAIKMLKKEYCDDANFVGKFRTEAQSAAGLEHPNIVNVYDVGNEEGSYFIVMEYVEGITLKTYIEKKGQLNFKEAISIAIQVGRGIEAAHAKGIIHRDIKPQNIIISTEGKVKVTDFGIARATTSNTIHSEVMGSVHYTSPEQARNGFVDTKSDIYSLGIVMYEMVTGRVPFDGDSTVAVAIKHLQEEMVTPRTYAADLPISLEKIILKCTQKSADKRYASISELLNDLKRALVSPDEDFVVMTDGSLGETKVISSSDRAALEAAAAASLSQPEPQRKPAKKSKKPTLNDVFGNDEDEYDEDEEYYEQDEYDEEYDEEYDDEYYDDDEYEDWEDEGRSKLFVGLGIGAGIIILAIIGLLVGNVMGLFGGSNKVQMVSVVGQYEVDARSTLAGLGFTDDTIKVKYEVQPASSEVMNGTVVKQSVEAGTAVKTKDGVVLTVAGDGTITSAADAMALQPVEADPNAGEANIVLDENGVPTLGEGADLIDPNAQAATTTPAETTPAATTSIESPNVIGNAEASAITAITDRGLKYNREYASSNQPEGTVIAQSPEAGTKLKTGDVVSITISSGIKSVTVPNVVGKDQTTAVKTLNEAGITVSSIDTQASDNVPAGNVIGQSIAADKVVDSGTTMTLTISRGANQTLYALSQEIEPVGDGENKIVLTDANGSQLWSGLVPHGKKVTLSASGIATPTGTITWYTADGATTLQSSQVAFTAQ